MIYGHCTEWAHLWVAVGNECAVGGINGLRKQCQLVLRRMSRIRGNKLCSYPSSPSLILPVGRAHNIPLFQGWDGGARRCMSHSLRARKSSPRFPVAFWHVHASMPLIGLCTVYRIDGITVAVYGRRHRTVRVLSKFGPYPATAQLTPYPTVFYGRIRP
jgi:hypothetical protein